LSECHCAVLWPSVLPCPQVNLQGLQLEMLTKFDSDLEEHEALLATVWKLLLPGHAYVRVSPLWQSIGFQQVPYSLCSVVLCHGVADSSGIACAFGRTIRSQICGVLAYWGCGALCILRSIILTGYRVVGGIFRSCLFRAMIGCVCAFGRSRTLWLAKSPTQTHVHCIHSPSLPSTSRAC
jgi:hypothetical protein